MPQLSKYVSIRSNERFRNVLQSWRYLPWSQRFFLHFSPHERAVRELRSGGNESYSLPPLRSSLTALSCGEKWRKTSGTRVEDTWRRQNLHAAILRPPAKRIQIKLYEPHLGKEKPVMGNIEPLLGITKPAEGLNKPCQGNVNGRKPFAAEGFNVKIPFISQTYTKAVAISFRQSHTRTRNLVKYHPRVVFTESFHAMVSTDEEVCWIQGHCTGILKIYAKISIIQALMWTSSQKQDWIVQTKILTMPSFWSCSQYTAKTLSSLDIEFAKTQMVLS